jgi:hypothetical protein
MARPRPNPEELCAQIEQEKMELWPDYALVGFVTARLDEANETVVMLKAYSSRDFAKQAAAKEKGPIYYFPLFKEPKTGQKWPSADEVYDYITY